MRTVRGLAALIALLLAAGIGAVALEAGQEAGDRLRSAVKPVIRDADGNIIGDDEDSATCRRVLDVVEAGQRAEDLGPGVLDPFLLPSDPTFVEVIEANLTSGGFEVRSERESDLVHPTTHPQVLAVGRLRGSLEDVADEMDRRAVDAGWEPAGEGSHSVDERPVEVFRGYSTGDGEGDGEADVHFRAVSCGRRGVFQHRVEPLRASRLPPCAGSPVASRCVELEALMEDVAGLPGTIELLPGGNLRATSYAPTVPVQGEVTGFLTVQAFQEHGWTWTNESDTGCRPWPLLDGPGGESPDRPLVLEWAPPCTGGGAPLAATPPVLRFTRLGAHARYDAEAGTSPSTTGLTTTTFTATPR